MARFERLAVRNLQELGLGVTNIAAVQTATDTATLTAAQVTGGLLVCTPTAAAAYTYPTGALLTAGFPVQPGIGDTFDLDIINVATGATFDITLTASTGITIGGGSVEISANDSAAARSSAKVRFRCTGVNTWVAYRV